MDILSKLSERLADLMEELAGRVKNPFATTLGLDFTSLGVVLLKIHNEKEFLRIKEEISKI